MIKDFRYIIKRVIIGVLICIAISCLNSCKVKALELDNSIYEFPYFNNTYVDLDDATDCENKDYFMISYNYAYGNLSSDSLNFGIPTALSNPNANDPTENIGLMCFNSSDIPTGSYNSYDSSTNTWNYLYASIAIQNVPIYYFKYNNNSKLQIIRYNRQIFNAIVGNAPADGLGNPYDFKKEAGETLYTSIYNGDNNYYILARQVLYSNINLNRCSSGSTLSSCSHFYEVWNNEYAHVDPYIVEINNAPLIKNNILVEMSLFPDFSYFDTENYDYQYGFSTDNDLPSTWLSLDYDYQWLQFRSNGTLFVRIKDKSNNEIIDTATFTIDNMGRLVEDEDAYIDITSEYRTQNYLNDNITTGSMSVIVENQLYLDYNPKSSFYRYFYQYIPVENEQYATEPNNNNWEELASSNNGSRTYVVSENGVLFAKMEDIDGNVVATANYKVTNIGQLATDNPNEKSKAAWYYRMAKNINFGGPIGSFINIPVTLFKTIYNGVAGVSGVCYSYNLGSLWGTNLRLPCVNLSHYLGALYTTIDIICSSVMIYFIFKMLSMAYDKFLRMERDPLSSEDFYRDNKD